MYKIRHQKNIFLLNFIYLSSALLLELKQNPSKIDHFQDNAFLYDLSSYLEWNGFNDTLSKVKRWILNIFFGYF